MRLLLIEDDEGDATLFRRALARSDIEEPQLQWRRTLAEGLAHMRAHGADVIVTDLGLPDVTGPADLIRTLVLEASKAPLIVLTGFADPLAAKTALQGGAQDYLPKTGLTSDALSRALRYATERHAQAEQLRSSEANLRHILASFEDPVYVRVGEEIVFANGAADVFLLRGGPVPRGAKRIHRRIAGQEQVFAVTTSRVGWGPRVGEMIRLRDLTSQENAAQLIDRLSMAEQFAATGRIAAGVAHELASPAATALVNLTCLNKELSSRVEEKEWVGKAIGDATGALEKIRDVVEQLRGFSRVGVESPVTFDIQAAVREVCDAFRTEHDDSVTIHLEETARDLYVRGRPESLRRAVANLLQNSVEAFRDASRTDKEVVVRVSAVGKSVRILVRDNGPGIPEAARRRIFSPFFSTRADRAGTGVGLTVARDVATRHGGALRLVAGCGGATFALELPSTVPATVKPRPLPVRSAPAPRRTVLVVDDDAAIRDAVGRLIRKAHDVILAASAREAIEELKTEAKIDAILCDLAMPDMDGPAFWEAIQRDFPEMAPRFVALTGGAFTPRTERFLRTSEAVVVHKPCRREDLLEAIERVAFPAARPAATSLAATG